MKIFRQKTDQEIERRVEERLAAEKSAQEEVQRRVTEDIERRKWAIDQATYLDELSPERVIKTAELIYKYVWGEDSQP